MRPKERVLAAVEHTEPDRVPIDFSAEREVLERLFTHFGHHDWDRLLEELNVDLRYIHPREVVYEKGHYVGPEMSIMEASNDDWHPLC